MGFLSSPTYLHPKTSLWEHDVFQTSDLSEQSGSGHRIKKTTNEGITDKSTV